MKKFFYLCLALSTLSGCGTMDKLHNKLADASVLKYKLADGNTVGVDTNVVPTADWNCSELGTPIKRNWAWLKTKSQFSASSPENYFTTEAIDRANKDHLDTNYINLTIPEVKSFGGVTLGAAHQQAIATFYKCAKINPDHKVGGEKSSGITF